MKRWPVFTLCFAAMAVLVWLLPTAASWLAYDREAILRGEIWRLWTCHFVHFSESHLGLNLIVVGLSGAVLEMRTPIARGVIFLIVPIGIAAGLLVTEPDMRRYGGLSGLASAILSYLALSLLSGRKVERLAGATILAGLAAKVFLEWGQPPLFASAFAPWVLAAPTSHVLGAALAAIAFGLQKRTTGVPLNRDFASVPRH